MRRDNRKMTLKSWNRCKEKQCKKLLRRLLVLSKCDIDNEALKVPQLKPNDLLFDARDTHSAPQYDEVTIQNGYASAAYILTKLINYSKDNFIKESIIYPAMFCLRQYIELSMKDSLYKFRCNRKSARRGESNLEGHHLLPLWNELKTHIDVIDTEVNGVESILHELENIDKSGTLFRYNKTFAKDEQQCYLPIIDTKKLQIRILQIYRFFEGVNELAIRNTEEKY